MGTVTHIPENVIVILQISLKEIAKLNNLTKSLTISEIDQIYGYSQTPRR